MSKSDKGAERVLRRFLDAGMKRDEKGMRACLSEASQAAGKFDPNAGPPPGTEFLFGEAVPESETTVVIPVLGKPGNARSEEPATLMMDCMMVEEKGEWKVDLATTMDRMMGGVIEQVAEKMGSAVETVAHAVGKALSDAFGGDDTTTADWNKAELAPRKVELVELPAMTTLPGLTKSFTEAVESKVLVMASDELLGVGGPEGRQTLIDWFEGPLFVCWIEAFQKAAETLPIKGRLRAVRLEYASWFENKTIVVDGSDLLYRMRLPESEGFYQDDMIAWCLPGVLAGLPETTDPRVTGKRLILTDDEYGDIDVYRERVVPTYMRRISNLLGRPIALQVDWSGIHDPASAVRQWQRWGINRVYGAIVLACADESLGGQLRASMAKIVLVQAFGLDGRYAKYENGVLELSFHDHGGEPVGFYEQDLYAVLAGEPIVAGETPEDDASPLNPANEMEAAAAAAMSAGDTAAQEESEEAAAAKLNDELFASAIATMKETEATWQDQICMFFGGRDVKLELDWNSLDGKHARIQPFVHRALSGSFEALARVVFDPTYKERITRVQRVFITSIDGEISPSVSLDAGALTMSVGLAPYDERPPTDLLTTELSRTLRGERHVSYGTPEPEGEPDRRASMAIPATVLPALDTPTQPTPTSAPQKRSPVDPYEAAAKSMDALELALNRNGMWPFQSKPEPLEVKGAFGCENMAFEQWLAWVLIPRVREVVATRGAFPASSEVGAYAVRALDGAPGGSEILSILSDFDAEIRKA